MKLFASVFLAVVCVQFASPAAAQPGSRTKPIRLVNGFAAGGGSDLLARTLAKPLGDHIGEQIAVENRVGAGGIFAMEFVKNAPPDGYTLIVGSSAAFTIAPND